MNRRTFSKLAAFSTVPLVYGPAWAISKAEEEWRPAKGPLSTRWAADVAPADAWKEYPRPGLVRELWQNLNGLWDYVVTQLGAGTPDQPPLAFAGKILVPFGIESQLSGVMQPFLPDQKLWYRRTFDIPEAWHSQRVLLNFDAVDFECRVWLNGELLGEHKGGYDRFTFDISRAIKDGKLQQLLLAVTDPSSQGDQAHGKQSLRPRGASYTATSGIWQTVWLEPVPHAYIASIKLIPDVDASRLRLKVDARNLKGRSAVNTIAFDHGRPVASASGFAEEDITLHLKDAKLWSPEEPFLYDLKITLAGGEEAPPDAVTSYFGMRKISIENDEQGIARLFLNGKPVFHQGPLDQGFWPDGIYTAPTDEALKSDLEYMKAVGFNAVRKHVKIEPDRWYLWADRLGLLVWQDMPAGQLKTPESREQWEIETARHVENHFNHPSIVMWVIFNEGWGQYDTPKLAAKLRKLDTTRLINNASGWYDKQWGDIVDMHFYPGPSVCVPEEKRASVTGEFGGLGFVTSDHMWKDGAWGYQTFTDPVEYNATYRRLWGRVHKLRDDNGLSAAIYTQISDVETESNGLLTYDRKVEKLDRAGMLAAHLGKHPSLSYKVILPMSNTEPQPWLYTAAQPEETWMKPEFRDDTWTNGEGGFGTRFGFPDFVRTRWNSTDLWVRRQFVIPPEGVHWPLLTCCFGVDFELYINGVLACRPEGFHNTYGLYELNQAARAAIRPGANSIAAHFIQRAKGGQQYIDIGLVDEIASGNE
jgi:hypothetical protein